MGSLHLPLGIETLGPPWDPWGGLRLHHYDRSTNHSSCIGLLKVRINQQPLQQSLKGVNPVLTRYEAVRGAAISRPRMEVDKVEIPKAILLYVRSKVIPDLHRAIWKRTHKRRKLWPVKGIVQRRVYVWVCVLVNALHRGIPQTRYSMYAIP